MMLKLTGSAGQQTVQRACLPILWCLCGRSDPSFKCIQNLVWKILRKNKPAEFVLKIKETWMNKWLNTPQPFGKFALVMDPPWMLPLHPLLSCFLTTKPRVLSGLVPRSCKCLGWIRMLFLCKNTRHFRNRKSLSGPTNWPFLVLS